MKQLLRYAGVLLCTTLLLAGCGPRDQDHHGDHDNNQPGQRDHNRQPGDHGSGQDDNHGSMLPDNHGFVGKDNGERAIVSYVDQHEIPVRITNIEQLPNLTTPAAHGTAAQTLVRYKVSMNSAGHSSVKIVRIVDYHPDTGELALER